MNVMTEQTLNHNPSRNGYERPLDVRRHGLIKVIGRLIVIGGLAGGVVKLGSELVDQINGAESVGSHSVVVQNGDTEWGLVKNIPSQDVPTGQKVSIFEKMNPNVRTLNPGETVVVPDSFNK